MIIFCTIGIKNRKIEVDGVVVGVYSGWDSSLLNMRVKFFLTNYPLYDFLLRGGGEVSLERRNIFLTPLSNCCRIGCIQSEVVCSHISLCNNVLV